MKKCYPNYLILLFILVLGASCGQGKKNEKSELQLQPSSIEVSIGGMTCTGCEQTIQTRVSRLDGIKSVKASHTAANAFIEYFPEKVDTVMIKEAINGAGYTVKKFITAAQD